MKQKSKSTMRGSRKAQFYIFAAVILCVIAFTMIKPKETNVEKDETFNQLYQNYIKEAGRAADNALLDGVNLKARFEDFNSKFKQFSDSKNIKFGFLGILSSNETIIQNKMGSDVQLNYLTTTETLSRNSIKAINWSNQLQVKFNDVIYKFNFTQGLTQVKGLFYARGSDYEKVYVYN